MNFILKTKYKIKLLFTDPIKFVHIIISMFRGLFVTRVDTGPEGTRWTTDIEKDILQKYSKNAKTGIVEIGILDGKTTKEIALVATVPVYGIDPLIPDSMNKKLIGSEEKVVKNLAFYKEFYFYKEYSFNLAKDWKHKFDFVFIDGDHTYKAVKKDFDDWFPLLDVGGIMAFHDSAKVTSLPSGSFDGWEGVVNLVKELKLDQRLKFIEVGDSLSVFKKLE